MKNYLAYKDQIQGLEGVSETVKTVEKIAASSIVHLRQELANLDFYQKNTRDILIRLIGILGDDVLESGKSGKSEEAAKSRTKVAMLKGKSVLIVLTSDKGLTGGLWRRITDEFLTTARGKYDVIIPIGSKGEKYLRDEGVLVEDSRTIESVSGKNIIQSLSEQFQQGLFSQIDILYPKYISLSRYEAIIAPFLPSFRSLQSNASVKISSAKSALMENASVKNASVKVGFPIFEPARSSLEIFSRLMGKYIDSYFKKISTEAKLSEFSSRTVAMENASIKTDELIKGLHLVYRKERRRLLTQRQLESFVVHKNSYTQNR
jgi:ATP synthase F1 gamma subunit